MNQYTGIYRRCELWFIRRELEQFGLQPLESLYEPSNKKWNHFDRRQ